MAWVTVLAPYLRASSWIRLSPAFIEHADEGWNAGAIAREPPLTVGDRHAEVEHFVDDRAHRRLAHRREHLARNGIERALDDLDGHAIKAGFPFHRSTSFGALKGTESALYLDMEIAVFVHTQSVPRGQYREAVGSFDDRRPPNFSHGAQQRLTIDGGHVYTLLIEI